MNIARKTWNNYITLLRNINDKAASDLGEWIDANFKDGIITTDYVDEYGNNVVDAAYIIAGKYANASASVAAQMYDVVAELEKASVAPAEPAAVPDYGEVAKTVQGVLKTSQNREELTSAVGRLVKRTGADTTLQNAQRDHAQFAWVPSGDTCAFCITLASRGWQYMSRNALKNGHAEHIHSNCDCTYAIRFDPKTTISGYNPREYLSMYENADGDSPKERINAMRRQFYAQNKAIVGAESDKAEELIPSVLNRFGKRITFERPESQNERVQALRNKQEETLKRLSSQYDTRLESVTGGAKQAAGDVDLAGQVMRLNSSKVEDAIHEFAHTLANTDADKVGLTDDRAFWSEIRKIRTEYRKAVSDDPRVMISSYADAQNILDEFMAEAFTLAKAKELGITLPSNYGTDDTYAQKVLKVINKYFGK